MALGVGQLARSDLAGGNTEWCMPFGNRLGSFFIKLNITPPDDPEVSLKEEWKYMFAPNLYTNVYDGFILSLVGTIPLPLNSAWINGLWTAHTMECYSAMKWTRGPPAAGLDLRWFCLYPIPVVTRGWEQDTKDVGVMEMLYDLIVVMGTWPFICQNSENYTLKNRVGDFTVCQLYLKKLKNV